MTAVKRLIDAVRERFDAPKLERPDRLQADIERGERAREMLESPLIGEYFASVERQLNDARLRLDLMADKERYRLDVAVKTVRGLNDFLTKSVELGTLAEKQLAELQSGRKPFF